MLDRKLTSDGKANQRSSFTFSMIMYRMIHFVLSTRVPAVRESVANYGGNINFKFAQTKGAFLHKIIKHSDTASGVCEGYVHIGSGAMHKAKAYLTSSMLAGVRGNSRSIHFTQLNSCK